MPEDWSDQTARLSLVIILYYSPSAIVGNETAISDLTSW